MYTEDDNKKYEYDKYIENSEQGDSLDNPYYINDNSDLNYDVYTETNDYSSIDKKRKKINKKRLLKLAIILILLIILSILIYFIVTASALNPRVNLLTDNITINAGESGAIAYEVLDTEERVPVSFVSMNEEIVTVDEYGSIYGVQRGTTKITMVYYLNGKRYEKQCDIIVE